MKKLQLYLTKLFRLDSIDEVKHIPYNSRANQKIARAKNTRKPVTGSNVRILNTNDSVAPRRMLQVVH